MELVRTQVRIPEDIAAWLKACAKEQNRSMNAQLVAILAEKKKQAG